MRDAPGDGRIDQILQRVERLAAKMDEFRAQLASEGISVATGAVLPRGEDDDANVDDGRDHPEEAKIRDPDATNSEKWEAWCARSERLAERRQMGPALRAYAHCMEYENEL